jgi:vacuolar-type H+-ATPase subunit H
MAATSQLRRRLRRAWAPPGAPAGGGVPSDPRSRVALELRPLLAAIDPIEEEADVELRRAAAEAEQIREGAHAEVARLLAAAEARAALLREETVAGRRAERESAAGSVLAAARERAADVRRRAATRLDAVAASVRDCVWASVDLGEGR